MDRTQRDALDAHLTGAYAPETGAGAPDEPEGYPEYQNAAQERNEALRAEYAEIDHVGTEAMRKIGEAFAHLARIFPGEGERIFRDASEAVEAFARLLNEEAEELEEGGE